MGNFGGTEGLPRGQAHKFVFTPCWLKHIILLGSKILLSPEMMSEANSSHSPLFLGHEYGKGQFYKL